MPHHEVLPLEFLDAGNWADIAEITGEPGWVSRMAELGIRTGTRLHVLQRGIPCLFQVGGTRLSLRGADAMQILVRPVGVASGLAG